jgi:dihydrofolate reductase
MIGIIAAVSLNGVIGCMKKDKPVIPWNYKHDMLHFKTSTINSNVIMGRRTFESMNETPLKNRTNLVVSSYNYDDVINCDSISNALNSRDKDKDTWFIGGVSIYEAGMDWADVIKLTVIPKKILIENSFKFPWINPLKFKMTKTDYLTDELKVLTYERY